MRVIACASDGKVRVDSRHNGPPRPHFKLPVWETIGGNGRTKLAVKTAFSICSVTGEPQDVPIAGKVLHLRRVEVPVSVIAWTEAPETSDNEPHPLTDRELEALQLFSEGLETEGVAARMDLSPSRVRHMKTEIGAKLGTQTWLQAAVWAAKRGLL